MSFPNGGSTGETKLYNARFRRAVCNTKRSCLNILDRSFQAITDFQEEDKCVIILQQIAIGRPLGTINQTINKIIIIPKRLYKKKKEKKKMRMSLKKQFFGINKINAQRL